jgi:hypothetical protein
MSGLLFPLGKTVATPRALDALERAGIAPASLLVRHQNGDWGELSPEDADANQQGLDHGDRILSSYPVGDGKVWIITEADRSATTLLLPEDY